MKLKCELQTVYRNGAGCPPSRKCQGLLVLSGRGQDSLLTAFTQRNTRGVRYRLNCLSRVHSRHAASGRTTLAFSEPPHDLLITGDALQVRAFLHRLNSGAAVPALSKGHTLHFSLSADGQPPPPSVAPATTKPVHEVSLKELQRAPQRLTVRSAAEYVRSFPPTLTQLTASGLRLRTVDSRLLRLTQLRSLDLSGNRLSRLPPLDRRLPQLCELRLADNQLRQLEPLTCRPAGSQLSYLDLSGNQLTQLPASMAFLSRLHYLNVANNQLTALPDSLANMAQLRVLNAAGNRLAWLPRQLETSQLMELDMHGNHGDEEAAAGSLTPPASVPSLLHQAACAVPPRLAAALSPAHLPLCLLELLTEPQRCRHCSRPCYPGQGAAAMSLTPGPLRHPRAALVHPTGAPLALIEYTCWLCRGGRALTRRGRAPPRHGRFVINVQPR